MESLLLSIHVVTGILFVGPIALATSLFTRYAPVGQGPAAASTPARSAEVARLLHRIARVYGVLALAVPIVGLALAVVQGRATEVWILVAMGLTAVAGALLAFRIVPRQREALEGTDDGTALRSLAMITGVFNLLWVAVVVLMVVRPGSSLG